MSKAAIFMRSGGTWLAATACLAVATRLVAAVAANRRDAFIQHKQPVRRSTRTNSETPRRQSNRDILSDEMADNDGALTLSPIGVVRSVYRLCVGTPRQGLLAPHARGRIELRTEFVATEGLDQFSHIWVVFVFHLNTVGRSQPSKIAPPALGGKKVGVLATRSPHRFNPVGMTLVKLDKVKKVKQFVEGRSRPLQVTHLEVSGLDLVDGTPVLDIKPYVRNYDAPIDGQFCVPSWVSDGLAKSRPVCMSDAAVTDLATILQDNPKALEFYRESTVTETISAVTACIKEVLAIDVRSQWQTGKARKNMSQAQTAVRLNGNEKAYSKAIAHKRSVDNTQQIDNLLVHFIVETVESRSTAAIGSGAEDRVLVQSIEWIKPYILTE